MRSLDILTTAIYNHSHGIRYLGCMQYAILLTAVKSKE